MDQVTRLLGEAGHAAALICQPHELQPPLKLPDGVRVVGINSNVKHSVGGGAYGRTRCAAFMAHA
jgi:L-arabinokinase